MIGHAPLPSGVWRALRTFVQPHAITSFVVPGDPAPKKRRVGQGARAFTPKATRDAEAAVRRAFGEVMPDWQPEPDHTYGVLIEFHTAASSKVDMDNAVKLIWDALNRVFWQDDIQVGDSYLRLVRGAEQPHSEVVLFTVEDNGTPKTRACPGCGDRYRAQAARCASCRRSSATVRELLAGSAADSCADEMRRHADTAFTFIVGQSAAGITPTMAQIAIRVGVSEVRARKVVQHLIDSGRLGRNGRRYTVPRKQGAAS